MLNNGNISENTGIEIMNKFNVPSAVIKTMFKMNPKWCEYILTHKKWNFGNVDDQLIIANNSETDEDTLYALSLVAKNNELRKAILAHSNCTLEIVRNMFK